MKKALIEAHDHFMRVSVSGPAIEPMYLGLLKLTQVINSLPDEVPEEIATEKDEQVLDQ